MHGTTAVGSTDSARSERPARRNTPGPRTLPPRYRPSPAAGMSEHPAQHLQLIVRVPPDVVGDRIPFVRPEELRHLARPAGAPAVFRERGVVHVRGALRRQLEVAGDAHADVARADPVLGAEPQAQPRDARECQQQFAERFRSTGTRLIPHDGRHLRG